MESLGLGLLIQKYRLDRNLSLYEIADALKYRVSQLEKIEAGDFSVLGELFFIKGFVRAYLQFLGVSAEEVSSFLTKIDALQQGGQNIAAEQLSSQKTLLSEPTDVEKQLIVDEVPALSKKRSVAKSSGDKGIDVSTGAFVFLVTLALMGLVWVAWFRQKPPSSQKIVEKENLVITSAASHGAVDVASASMVALESVVSEAQDFIPNITGASDSRVLVSQSAATKSAETVVFESKKVDFNVVASSAQPSIDEKEDSYQVVEVAGGRQVSLGFVLDEEVWIEFRRGSRVLMSRVLVASPNVAEFRFSLPVDITFSKSRHVRLTINGKSYSLKNQQHKPVVRLRLVGGS